MISCGVYPNIMWKFGECCFIRIWTSDLYTVNWGNACGTQNQKSCLQAVPTLSLPQLYCCSASELPSSRLCVFTSGVSSSLCMAPEVLSREGPWFEVWSSVASAGHAAVEMLSVGLSKALFSSILLLISFWNLHICSCSSLMKFTTVCQTESGRRNLEKKLLLLYGH